VVSIGELQGHSDGTTNACVRRGHHVVHMWLVRIDFVAGKLSKLSGNQPAAVGHVRVLHDAISTVVHQIRQMPYSNMATNAIQHTHAASLACIAAMPLHFVLRSCS
jgi:hypothetical protein